MSQGSAPPHLGLPGVAKTVKKFFPVRGEEHTWQPTAAGQTRRFLVDVDDLAVNADVKISVLWSSDAGAGSATFIPTYKSVLPNTTTLQAGEALTAVDSAIGADTAGSADVVQETPQANIVPGSLTDAAMLVVEVEIDAVATISLGSDAFDVYGIFVEYTRKKI